MNSLIKLISFPNVGNKGSLWGSEDHNPSAIALLQSEVKTEEEALDFILFSIDKRMEAIKSKEGLSFWERHPLGGFYLSNIYGVLETKFSKKVMSNIINKIINLSLQKYPEETSLSEDNVLSLKDSRDIGYFIKEVLYISNGNEYVLELCDRYLNCGDEHKSSLDMNLYSTSAGNFFLKRSELLKFLDIMKRGEDFCPEERYASICMGALDESLSGGVEDADFYLRKMYIQYIKNAFKSGKVNPFRDKHELLGGDSINLDDFSFIRFFSTISHGGGVTLGSRLPNELEKEIFKVRYLNDLYAKYLINCKVQK